MSSAMSALTRQYDSGVHLMPFLCSIGWGGGLCPLPLLGFRLLPLSLQLLQQQQHTFNNI